MTDLTRRQTVTAGAASAIAATVASAPGQADAKGPNDRRLWELVPQIDAAATVGDTPRVHALDREMRDTPADSASGLLAKLRGYFLKEPLPSEATRAVAHYDRRA